MHILNRKIHIEEIGLSIKIIDENNYISLTDMVRNVENGGALIEKWLRNKNTIEFLGIWESMYNENFNSTEFEGIKNRAGVNRFIISAKQWINSTNSIGLIAKAGRYGGTYAHKDIAFEFASWLSPKFKLYLIREFDRLKEKETSEIEWESKRFLSKANYLIHTDAVKRYILPKKDYMKEQKWLIYAEEADLLNVVLFGCTAKDWRLENKELAKKNNIRDFASINELVVLSNLESYNAKMIKDGISKEKRFKELYSLSNYQLGILNTSEKIKSNIKQRITN